MTPSEALTITALVVGFIDAAYHHAPIAAVVLGCACAMWIWAVGSDMEN